MGFIRGLCFWKCRFFSEPKRIASRNGPFSALFRNRGQRLEFHRLDPDEGFCDGRFKRAFPNYVKESPEQYAAWHAHRIGCYSYHLLRYRDPKIERWAVRLWEILIDGDEAERCRRSHLSRRDYGKVTREREEIDRDPMAFFG